uniref:Amino acid transporter transmembrane domain-containing protein n=2 Tax=Dendroctonus ponderosae TaxID=77166 RepID=A0AAR5P7B4_DENPD
MGDLGPAIVSEIIDQDSTSTMRISIMLTLAVFCVLPLGLLKNIDSFSGVSKATIGFYVCLVLKIVIDAVPHIFRGDWINKVELWKPAGVLQCLPIFSMALSCQTQLFEIYRIVNNPSLEKMNHVIKNAVNICTIVYFFVGVFGYIAFSHKNFSGNILLSFSSSSLTNVIKLGFILSIAFSFPLVIFPCRASFHSLIYRHIIPFHEGTAEYIPEARFKGLTLIIVFVSLLIGILIPNIEFVLGLVGSSIGIMICVLFPVMCFINVSDKDNNEKLLAKCILFIGIILMILGTYENLKELNQVQSYPVVTNVEKEILNIEYTPPPIKERIKTGDVKLKVNESKPEVIKLTDSPEIRHEPPQPVEPQDSQHDLEVELEKNNLSIKEHVNKDKQIVENQVKKSDNIKTLQKDNGFVESNKIDTGKISPDASRNVDNVDVEAIKKEGKEALLQGQDEINDSHLKEHKILIDKIQKQNEVQQEIVKQQKKLIEVIEKQQEQKENDEKLKAEIKAVKEIESIALKAIEKLSGDIKKNDQIVAKVQNDVLQKVDANVDSLIGAPDKDTNKTQSEPKIEDLKLMNSVLSAKIKENNITQENPLKDEMKINENMLLPEQTNAPNVSVNVVANKANILDKSELLSENAVPNVFDKTAYRNMLPLPLVVYHFDQNNKSKVKKRRIIVNKSRKLDKINARADAANLSSEEVKAMRRDILAYDIFGDK